MVSIKDNYAEYVTLLVMIFSCFLTVAIRNELMSYIVIFLSGFAIGKYYYEKRKWRGFPTYMVTAGYLLVYIISAHTQGKGHAIPILIFYFIGHYLGYLTFRRYPENSLKDRGTL